MTLIPSRRCVEPLDTCRIRKIDQSVHRSPDLLKKVVRLNLSAAAWQAETNSLPCQLGRHVDHQNTATVDERFAKAQIICRQQVKRFSALF